MVELKDLESMLEMRDPLPHCLREVFLASREECNDEEQELSLR